MDKNTQALLLLDDLKQLTYLRKQKIIALFDNVGDIMDIDLLRKKQSFISKIADEDVAKQLLDRANQNYIDKIVANLEAKGINYITYLEKDYPKLLSNIDTPPFVLYYKGDIKLLKSFCLAVVGSRKITNYGLMATQKFVKDLVKFNITIVSGLAYGVDSTAHKETLSNNGKTIAVLAGGLDNIYPPSNISLANQIVASGGLLVSEYPPNTKLETHMFPIRNRIIAGLSKGVLITEAYESSGVMHTKNYALDYGRDVFAVVGSIFSEASAGTNRLVVNNNAKAVTKIEDIVEEYNLVPYITKIEQKDFTLQEQVIIDFLSDGEKTFQNMADNLEFSTSTLNTLLTKLTIRGIIKKLAGNTYFLN